MPVTPTRNIKQISVEELENAKRGGARDITPKLNFHKREDRDHERYSAIDRRLYKQ